MAIYDLYARERPGKPLRMALVDDGFSLVAFFFPLIWGIWKREWAWLLAWLFAMVGFTGLLHSAQAAPQAEAAIMIALNAVFAALAPEWRRWRLEQLGYVWHASAAAARLSEAERILLARLRYKA